jgi:serine/threonine protein kinase
MIWKIFVQVMLALYECHKRKEGKILHRDIKPGNIFLDSNKNVKLGDFGLSRMMAKESMYAHSNVGTPYYMSPEQVNEAKYNEKSDIWSVGCLLYEMTSLEPPFLANNHLSLAMKIKAGKFTRIPKNYSEELQRVISWMLSVEQLDRPYVEDILNVPQVSMRLREKKLKEHYVTIKKKEDEIKRREVIVGKREEAVEKKEEQCEER